MNPSLVVLLCAMAMIVIEQLWPGTRSPRVRGWLPRAALFNGAQGAVAFIGAATWDQVMARSGSLFALSLAGAAGLAGGYLLITFVYYWWHRARHAWPWLWRCFHQLHHSPRRIEIVTSFYKHPIELIANGLLSGSLLFLVLGLSPKLAGAVVLITGVAELFYHWNVRTPYWLGYVFQRPEMHRVHHQRGRHTDNFSDLPVWDLLFGTWNNPRRAEVRCGFDAEAEQRVADMLLLRDVNRSRPKRARQGGV
jgi:sterol desaturase/sphingolipid hydroxylase (fatty acid hydroxylase superfamily)